MKFIISSEYGAVEQVRNMRPHTGIDVPLEMGTKLRAFIDGTVEKVINSDGLGKGVIIRGEDGYAYGYGHLSKVTVKVGQHVEAGQDIIGLSGSTGHSTGPHLHFFIQEPGGAFVDPAPAIKALESVTGGDPLGQYLGSQPMPGGIMDWFNHLGDKAIGAEQAVAHPVWSYFKGVLQDLGHWFVGNLPDIMGYGAVLAGICIILGSMTGKGGMMKPLSIYAGLLILALCILGS